MNSPNFSTTKVSLHTVFVNYAIALQHLLAAMKDLASVNEAAVQTLKIVYSNLLSVGCYSLTIDRVGKQFYTPNLSCFITSGLLIAQRLEFYGLNRLKSHWLPTCKVQLTGGAVGK